MLCPSFIMDICEGHYYIKKNGCVNRRADEYHKPDKATLLFTYKAFA